MTEQIHWAIDALLATGLLASLALALRGRLNARLQQASARLAAAAESNPIIGRAIDSLLFMAATLADSVIDETEAERIATAIEAAVREQLK